MSYSVTVLHNNGKRQRVPVKLNTPILMILEETCKKHMLNPNEYDLKFHNRILDVTSTVQFCGIANNVQLELVPASKLRTEMPVTVFLQLESGERLSGSFLPSRTLSDIINELCSEDINTKENPVIIYTRQEVYGEKLKSTSLKMIGLTSGSALLRLIHRTEDQLKNQSVSSVYRLPLKPKPVIEKPRPIHEKSKLEVETENEKCMSSESAMQVDNASIITDADSFTKKTDLDGKNSKNEIVPSESPMLVDDASMITNIDSNIVSSSRKMELTEKNSEKKEADVCTVIEKDDLISEINSIAGPSASDVMNEKRSNFNINEIEYIGERYALLFRIDSMQSPRFRDPADDDDFYELTIEDAKTLLRDIKRTRSELEEGTLETSAAKARKKSVLLERTLSIYPQCVVRVLFPNRIILQGVFKSTETILDVVNFTESFLEHPVLNFYLYTCPPKTILKINETLLDIGAIPGINIYFGSDQVEYDPTGSFVKHQFLDKMVSPSVALDVANHFRRTSRTKNLECMEKPLQPSISNETNASRTLSTSPAATVQREASKKPAESGKVPKWFKLH